MLLRLVKDMSERHDSTGGQTEFGLFTPDGGMLGLRLAHLKAGATIQILPLGWESHREAKVGDVIFGWEVVAMNKDDRDALASPPQRTGNDSCSLGAGETWR